MHVKIFLFSTFIVVVSTAASTEESSYAYYYFNKLGTCLGDEYSAAWMKHVESVNNRQGYTKLVIYVRNKLSGLE